MAGRKSIIRFAWGIVAFMATIVVVLGVMVVRQAYMTNVVDPNADKDYLYIPTGSGFEDVIAILHKKNLLLNEKSFRWTAEQMKYDSHVLAGRYKLKPKMSNKELISLLRSGRQEAVKLTINNIRTKEQLAQQVSEQLEIKPAAILSMLNDTNYTRKLGFSTAAVLSMFLPNTYEVYWNTSAEKFLMRMKREYDKYWNQNRLQLAKKMNLSPVQVSILASIVQLESNKEDEKPIIAGVYLNRFRKDWKLEADPTLIYALGDFSVSRVLNAYKEIDSPYNTYRYKGLPPGPICLPTMSSLSAVLNSVPHSYMYFCAKDDFSGYHAFATTYSQHLVNARKFRMALDKRGIRS